MHRHIKPLVSAALVVTIAVLFHWAILAGSAAQAGSSEDMSMHNWPQWRGPLGTGEAPHGDPPVTWDENTNIRWKVPLPGLSHATPVVWGDRIYVLAAVPESGRISRSRGMWDTYST